MLNIKQIFHQALRSLAVTGLLVALIGAFLATPGGALANDPACEIGKGPSSAVTSPLLPLTR